MSTFLSAYTISMFDTVETGREKINFLITGDTSPFFIWSGNTTTNDEIYLSVFKNINNSIFTGNSNNIIYYENTGVSNFNLIFNGEGNSISTTGTSSDFSGSFNLVNGISNFINQFPQSPAAIYASGNTVVGQNNIIQNGNLNLINGINNNLTLNYPDSVSFMVSSNNSSLQMYGQSNMLLSSYNSRLSQNGSSGSCSFISGDNNVIHNGGFIGAPFGPFNFNFIGNGQNNKIVSSNQYQTDPNYFSGIINGQNNVLNPVTNNNSILFGSNLTAVTNNYSHFQNLNVNGTLMSANFKSYNNLATVNLDPTYSYHVVWSDAVANIDIIFPQPTVDLQFLTLTLINALGSNIQFSLDNLLVNIISKSGSINQSTSILPGNNIYSYFFIWTNILQAWVMFTSNCDNTATF